jgi:large subunit ribosomal protein L24
MNKIRKGDQVVVISGRDKGRRGAVIRVLDAEHLLVENVNRVKRHQRANPQGGVQGGIVEKEMPLHRSKVAIWNASQKKADRVGVKTLADGKKVRIFKSNSEVIDV